MLQGVAGYPGESGVTGGPGHPGHTVREGGKEREGEKDGSEV
jgi:hypothetical protein